MEKVTHKLKRRRDACQIAPRARHLTAGAYRRYNAQPGYPSSPFFSAVHCFLGFNWKAPGLKPYHPAQAQDKILAEGLALPSLAVFFARIQPQHVGRRP